MSSLDNILLPLQQLLAGFGIPEESLPMAAMATLYLLVTIAVGLFVLVIWRVKRSGSRPAADSADIARQTEDETPAGEERPDTGLPADEPEPPAVSGLERLRFGLSKTRESFVARLEGILGQAAQLDAETVEELEELLITSDFGMPTTTALLETLERRLHDNAGQHTAYELLQAEIAAILLASQPAAPGDVVSPPEVIMIVGVNGVGKTTTIGKLASLYRRDGKSVLLAAGDTFRAAASDQLAIWAERAGADLVRHEEGGDPAAVAFDAAKAAVARKSDVLIVDTAGRLHTKVNLMEELKKVRRVLDREIPGAPHQVLLVVDATTGQNALAQARLFREAVDVDGLVLTKLDGTAKGGIVVAISADLGIPVRYIGVGEKVDDLRPFDAEMFARALFGSAEGA